MDTPFERPEDFAADESFIHYCLGTDEADTAYWVKWLKDHPEKRQAAEKGKALVFLMGLRLSPEEKQQEFKKLHIRVPTYENDSLGYQAVKTKSRTIQYLIMGAIFLVMGGVLWKMAAQKNISGKTNEKALAAYVAPSGETKTLVLDDGTRIVLNTSSRLTVNPAFGNTNRKVTLSGEAYFDVAPDADRPFIIQTDNMEITVLGTTLNVKDYPGDKKAEAALITGSVAVKLLNESSKSIILKPDEKIVAYKNVRLSPITSNKKLQINDAAPIKHFSISPLKADPLLDSGTVATAWMEDKLVFRDESFDDLAAQMARKYGVQFHFTTSGLRQYRFTGIFSKETVEEALKALQLTSPSDPFDFSIKGKDIYITRKQPGS